jgi:hypothetical protein
MMDVPPERLFAPLVTMADFMRILETARPTVGKGDLDAYKKFTDEFGQEG